MKKLPALLLTILGLTIIFASCNLDGTSGIFREIAQSKEPLSIRYKQLLGDDGTYLYFRTLDGVERVTTAKVKTTVVANKFEHIIHNAALYSSTNELLFITNNENEQTNNEINVIDTSTNPVTVKPKISVTDIGTIPISSEFKVENLYANSMILVSGKNGSGAKVYELLQYKGAAFTSVATFTMPNTQYGIHAVIQQTSKEQDATAPMIVSFVNGDGDRIHYLVEPSGPTTTSLGTEDVQIANFVYQATNTLYVLTTEGKIYHVNGTTWTSIASSSKTYTTNAFALPVDDGANYQLITKPSTKNASLHVFTFPNTLPNTAVGAGVDVKSGYAKELALATIVSSQVKTVVGTTSTDLLIATDENGMYDIFIQHADANKDISTNGTSSEAEGYTFP